MNNFDRQQLSAGHGKLIGTLNCKTSEYLKKIFGLKNRSATLRYLLLLMMYESSLLKSFLNHIQ